MIAYLPPCNQKTTPNFKRGFSLHSGLKPVIHHWSSIGLHEKMFSPDS